MSSEKEPSPLQKREGSPASQPPKNAEHQRTITMEQSGSSTPTLTSTPIPDLGQPSTPPTTTKLGVSEGQTKGPDDDNQTALSDQSGGSQQPQSPLDFFDWDSLDHRFQEMIQTQDNEEEKLWSEFRELMDFFKIWVETTQTHEVDRSMKRLATRMNHVQNSEIQLEHKRQHYVSVVEAFQRALELLNAS